MTSLHFVVHPLPGTDEQLNERLKAISDKLNRFGSSGASALSNLRVVVKQIVVGPTHFALLLEDGRICRVSFSIITDRLDLSNGDPPKKSLVGARQMNRARARLVRSTQLQRSGSYRSGPSGSIMSRPVVTPLYVPEELVAHAQVVLQGKSRNLIIRELQRTNLDVNLAVNNLLSRDEEEGDETEDAQDSYVPEDLISLLDGGFHEQHSVIIDTDTMFSEDMFGYSAMRRGGSSSRRQPSGLERDREGEDSSRRHGDRDSFSRWRDRQYFGPRKWLESALSSTWDNYPDSKKKEMAQQSPLWTSDELEYWPDNNARFTMMAALHSELVAVSSAGQLYQWRWADPEPYRHPDNLFVHHPKTVQLGLLCEKITMLSGTIIRASAVTESNKVCTWVDESLTPLAAKLEHPLINFPELGSDKISSLHTCALYTLVRMDTGAMYWWGVLPFAQRRKLWEKFRAKSRKNRPSSNNQELAVGNQVCMKNAPVCQPGAIGFTISCGMPRVGVLQNAAWNLTDVCRFKLLPTQPEPSKSSLCQMGIATTLSGLPSKTVSHKETADRLDMPPPPSPASSTCSDTGSTSHKRAKRPTSKTSEHEERKDEEEWLIRNVIFLEDVKSVPVGRVLKVDGAYAAVRFPTVKDGKECKEAEDSASLLQDCRLMRVEDLQVLKSNTTSRAPDCFQRVPKRVNTPENGNVLALTVDVKGIHCIVKNGSKLSYVVYNLANGRVDQESVFPADCCTSFLGLQPNNIQLTRTGESNEGVVIVRDGNSTIFPMAKDCLDSVRDPQWLDLPPVRCLGAGIHALSSLPNKNMKNQVAVIILAVEAQLLMQRILRCDLEGIKAVLSQMEAEAKSGISGVNPTVANVLAERCDGNRNIIHACVTMCVPTANNEEKEATPAPAPTLTDYESINVITNALGSRTSNLREMMRRASAAIRVSPQRSRGPTDGVDADVRSPSEEPIPTLNWPPDPLNHSGDEDSFMDLTPPSAKPNTSSGAGCSKYVLDPLERKNNSLAALKLLCESPALEPHLLELLSAKDAQGQTPFMMGVSLRAYPAAAVILDAIQMVAGKQPESEAKTAMNNMIYPPKSNPDHNPLHVLCCNDTCSFTWTGAEHINQDIFECRTCGLTGSLCCCTECARVCHRGHDCKLKKTSPTAYCDCWEKCKCKALIMGNQTSRFQLLCHLVLITELVAFPNTRGENILLFLVQTVGRQSVEQRQYRTSSRPRSTSNNARKTPSSDVEMDMPDHDLEPPRFCRRALERLLNDWNAVRSMLMSGVKVTSTASGGVAYLQSQSGTTLLDKFTHCLLVKCSTDMLDTLLTTLIRELQNDAEAGRQTDAKLVARRFIRSVARIFVIFSIEMTPSSTKKRGANNHSQHILKCRRAFQALIKLAIEELCEIADSLIAPVRLGVVRPTAPFTLASNTMDVLSGSEELFSVEPLSLNGGGTSSSSSSAPNRMPPATPAQQPSATMELDEPDTTEGMAVDDDTSEQEDAQDRMADRGEPLEGENHDMTGNQLEDGDQRDDQSDTTELDLLVESESDSDDNQDNPSTQSRSEQTAATVGSDTDDDSGESSQQEEEESEAGETDEQEAGEVLPLTDEQLERRPPVWSGSRNNLAPHSMQWAIRAREPRPIRPGGMRVGNSSSLVFIDPSSLRRSNSAAAAAQAQAQANCEPVTMATTASCLARAFAIVVRQIADLLTMLQDYQALTPILPRTLDVSSQESMNIQLYLEFHLKPTWDWLLTVMDSTEAQLRFGASLTHSSDPAHPGHPLHQAVGGPPVTSTGLSGVLNTTSSSYSVSVLGTSGATTGTTSRGQSTSSPRATATLAAATGGSGPRIVGFSTSSNEQPRAARDRDAEVLSGAGGSSARRELLSYCLSLMRAHNSEHLDSLPVLDVSALKHIAYVLDALIYYMRSGFSQDTDVTSRNVNIDDTWATDQDENENEENEEELNRALIADTIDENETICSRGRKHPFLQRSDSTLCLGCPPPDPFELPLTEALPLADQPHLLQPNARREELFGMPKQPITIPPTGSNAPGTFNPLESLPTRLGLSMRTADTTTASGAPVMSATPSAHLAPCAGNPQEKPRQPAAPHDAKPQTFLDMYDHLMREMEDTTGGTEEPQDLSLHQLSQDTAKMDVDFSDSYSDSDYEASRSSVAGKSSKEEERRDGKSSDLPPLPEPVGEHSGTSAPSKSKKPGSPTVAAQTLINLSLNPPLFSGPPPSPPGPSNLPSRAPIIVTSKNVASAIALAIEIASPATQKAAKEEPRLNLIDIGQLTAPASGKSVIVRAGSSSQNSLSTEAPDVLVVPTVPRTSDDNGENSAEIAHISTHVTVETTPTAPVHRPQPTIGQSVSHDLLLGRWRLSLDLFGRVFMEDVGLEPGSVVAELGGFPVKEAKFRREMERLRNANQRDLTLSKLERDRASLIVATMKELNTHYKTFYPRTSQTPLGVDRVKVTFKDEPGEGSGVARSFYTAISEALLANEKLPNLEAAMGIDRLNPSDIQRPAARSSSASIRLMSDPRPRRVLSLDARPFKPAPVGTEAQQPNRNEHLSNHQKQLGDKLYPKVYALRPSYAGKITGMLLELNSGQLLMLLASEETLRQKVDLAFEMILNFGEDSCSAGQAETDEKKPDCELAEVPEDNSPLFYTPGKRGFYCPRQGRGTFQRLNAFRNVGRLLGLCLLQNELCPIFLSRHVLKYILGRMIRFHDLAFFDPSIYESLRMMVLDAESKDGPEILAALDLTFSVDLDPEEGGGVVELVPGGREIAVTVHNVYDYVRKYAHFRMVKTQEKALAGLRLGVFDVLPSGALDGLTAEDLRLLLNGVGDINVSVLISYTSFNNESGETSERLVKFKRWLWSIVDKMTPVERQDLVYFWTGSPALPASEDGFQPMPSVTIRPADDVHLPTANTCISRLYIPLYSCRQVLRQKLLIAIKTKNFGFV